jgi:hypothetical protein
MASAKNVILTAISFKGATHVKNNAKDLADDCLCSEKYVKRIVRKVENGTIKIGF